MTVLITLTTAGADSGPFDLYSDLDGYVSAFESGVSKASLLAGYSSALVPNGTTTIRIKSVGTCVNFIDIVLTTTTTTTSSTTTTTTTALPLVGVSFSAAAGSGVDGYLTACTESAYPQTFYCGDNPIIVGSILYDDNLGATEVVGANLWYKEQISLTSYRIDNFGVVTDLFVC